MCRVFQKKKTLFSAKVMDSGHLWAHDPSDMNDDYSYRINGEPFLNLIQVDRKRCRVGIDEAGLAAGMNHRRRGCEKGISRDQTGFPLHTQDTQNNIHLAGATV